MSVYIDYNALMTLLGYIASEGELIDKISVGRHFHSWYWWQGEKYHYSHTFDPSGEVSCYQISTAIIDPYAIEDIIVKFYYVD